ncbi:MAG: DEAD/DEAH box helicase family protein [Candidatus Scalindua sp.]|nr:DEAD/DEAH box helicase family protein [Candidatus Scalindua sp.]
MLKEVEWSSDRSYRSKTENEPLQFYLDGLFNSNQFELLLGYFSSAAINVLSLGFATFLHRGGRMRLVINNVLSLKDRDAIQQGLIGDTDNVIFDLSDIENVQRTLDEYGKHFFECISWLIANSRIELKIIKPKDSEGIAHYKSGTFSDGDDVVGFKASSNFTAFALLENLEELDAFLSWENGRSKKMITSQKRDFDALFSGTANYVEYLEAEDVKIAIRDTFGDKSLNDLLAEEKILATKKKNRFENPVLKKTVGRLITQIDAINNEPKFPYPSGPREYQRIAYKNWVQNGHAGIFGMATGTGKTITALNCVLEEYRRSSEKIYKAIILVPTLTLVKQWEKEVLSFNYNDVYKVASIFPWKQELLTLVSTSKHIPIPFIIISTYASFVKKDMQNVVKLLPKDTIFIADEGHNLAAPEVAQCITDLHLTKRIGLSATPKRIYDPEGTSVMEDFFSDREPYTYSFSLGRAIREDVLCQYFYYPHIIHLTDEELSEYRNLSLQLAKLYQIKPRDQEIQKRIESKLLARKRIIHKAENKLPKTIDIMADIFKENGNKRYILVYVPEGKTFVIHENEDESNIDNIRIINQYTREIAKLNENILVNQFISGKKDRDEILNQFAVGDINVIASMKCLDEGIDIPRAETAIFCSSTGNPRQFIQRRGRILRKHPEKRFAYIHDLVVIPDYQEEMGKDGTYEVERNLTRKELERVMYFASLSKNPYHTEEVFDDICNHYGLNLYTIQNELREI